MERKFGRTKLNLGKLSICTLLIAVVFSASAVSMAHATSENTLTQVPPDNTAAAPDGNPTLIATEDNSTMTLDDTRTLTRTQDNSTITPDDNSTLYTTEDTHTEDNPPLIATQSQPDNTFVILGVAVLLAAIAVGAVVVVARRRKKISA